MALLGNLIYAGLQTLLSTQGALGSTQNLYSINTAAIQNLDVALFQVGHSGAQTGGPQATLQPALFTRTGSTVVFANPNTTALSGDILAAFWHSRVR